MTRFSLVLSILMAISIKSRAAIIARNTDGKIVVLDSEYNISSTDLLETFEDGEVYMNEYQWGLDRIDQTDLPMDNKPFSIIEPGKCHNNEIVCGENVYVYVLDTGANPNHIEFNGRVLPGWGYSGHTTNDNYFDDNGHGTHVASTIAGNTVGVAKCSKIIPVKVLDSRGQGKYSGVIKALQRVILHSREKNYKHAIVNMSLLGGKSVAVNEAVKDVVKNGIQVIVGAGNYNRDACNYSPSSSEYAITVGATDMKDNLASFSNWGGCVDILAPGVSINGAGRTYNGYSVKSGTSMSCPHVSGAYAIYLSKEKNNESFLDNYTVEDRINRLPKDTVNYLLHIRTHRPLYCDIPRKRMSRKKRRKWCNKQANCSWYRGDCLFV